jgi:transcription elongation factor GreA
MANRNYPMTAKRLQELREELKYKEEVERSVLAARLKAAIEMGDLSENADYHDAKETQGFLEGRIQELKAMILGAEIIDENQAKNTPTSVQLGSRITVVEEGESETETFFLVGKVEANPREGKISNESPLGAALLGKKPGDTVKISTPNGDTTFKITKIE